MALKGKQPTNNLRGWTFHGGNVPNWTAEQNNVARQVMVEFMAQGASAAGAAGVVGNWYQESSLNPRDQGGYLAQWLGSRLASLRSYAAQIGAPVTSVEAQARFAITEMKTEYPELWKFLATTKDPRAAALAVSQQYERPAAYAANNTNRQNQAAAAYQYLAGGINPDVSQIYADGSGGGGNGGGGPTSVLGLLTSPVDQLGGWLAKIAFNLTKDAAIAFVDDLVIPFWHWNQRSVANYMSELKGNQLLWTAVFWGFGYGLLFTDPDSGNLRPAPVRRSRLARHVRTGQSLPAKMSLVKPKDVERKTPRKPKPVISKAPVTQTGTMQAVRSYPVHVTGTHARGNESSGERSEVPVEREGTRAAENPETRDAANRESNARHRARSYPLQDRAGNPRGNPGARSSGGNKP